MNNGDLTIEKRDLVKLLSTTSGDAAILYLYLQSGNDPEQAMPLLNMNGTRHACAMATLRQLGLWQPEQKKFIVGERPNYTEDDVLSAKDDRSFQSLLGELEKILGRPIVNADELKIVLGFIRYLGLDPEVISILFHFCVKRAHDKSGRNPSFRTIEKEAYFWAEQGVDTVEDAAAYIHNRQRRKFQIERLKEILQIRNRDLTPAEEKYADGWVQMGLSEELILEAYQRTCLNTGNMNWPYMNKILTRWHETGLRTLEQVKNGDKKQTQPKGATGHLGTAELDAMKKFLEEGNR